MVTRQSDGLLICKSGALGGAHGVTRPTSESSAAAEEVAGRNDEPGLSAGVAVWTSDNVEAPLLGPPLDAAASRGGRRTGVVWLGKDWLVWEWGAFGGAHGVTRPTTGTVGVESEGVWQPDGWLIWKSALREDGVAGAASRQIVGASGFGR